MPKKPKHVRSAIKNGKDGGRPSIPAVDKAIKEVKKCGIPVAKMKMLNKSRTRLAKSLRNYYLYKLKRK